MVEFNQKWSNLINIFKYKSTISIIIVFFDLLIVFSDLLIDFFNLLIDLFDLLIDLFDHKIDILIKIDFKIDRKRSNLDQNRDC